MSAPSCHPRPCHWCGRMTGSPRRVCCECVSTDTLSRKPIPTTGGIEGGHWVPARGILRWEQVEPVNDGRAKCGTDGGYYSHLRHTKTEPCWECRVAHAKAERERQVAS